MNYITIKGYEGNGVIEMNISNVVLGAADAFAQANFESAEELLLDYVLQGGNIIDTARHYRTSEQTVGQLLEKHKLRDKVFILTKGCHPLREAKDVKRVNKKGIEEDVAMSLEMLKVDYIDLYCLHRDDESVPVKEIMDTLDYLVKKGYVRSIGVSNWELERIKEAQAYASEKGLTPLSFTSPNYSLAKSTKPRWPECVSANDEMIEWHKKEQIALLSWSSQAGGFFSGKFSKEDRTDEEMVECYYTENNWEKFDRCKKLAQHYQVEPIQISLSYVTSQKFPCAAIIGPMNVEELRSSLSASNIKLSKIDIEYLELKRKSILGKKFAAQMYSLRADFEKDARATLTRIKEIGFEQVQLDGMRGNNPIEVAKILQELDLKIAGMHIKHSRFFDDVDGIIFESILFGCKDLYLKYIDDDFQNEEGYRKTKAAVHNVIQKLNGLGYRIGFHNPEFDFHNMIDGNNVIDYICKPEENRFVYPELDTYWLTVANENPVEYAKKYAYRMPIVHLKDKKSDQSLAYPYNICECGNGVIDLQSFIKVCEELKVEAYCIEQDHSDLGMLESMKVSFENLLEICEELS